MSTSATPPFASIPSPERTAELYAALSEIRARISVASASNSAPQRPPTLVAVSKFKPAEDLRACYDAGQRDFGENYAQQLVEKATVLPRDVRWHFIGTVQSNKAKVLAGIENLYAVQTVASTRCADALNRYRAVGHAPLRVFIQLNTSGEQTKGGIDIASSSPSSSPSLSTATTTSAAAAATTAGATGREGESEGGREGAAAEAEEKLTQLAVHIVRSCPRLRLVGLMTIGKLDGGEEDFVALREARDRLVRVLPPPDSESDGGVWGEGEGEGDDDDDDDDDAPRLDSSQSQSQSGEGEDSEKTRAKPGGRRRLLLSMGMSHDFEMALRTGADVVRVGTGIFGARPVHVGQGARPGRATC